MGSRQVLWPLPGVGREEGQVWTHTSCQNAASASLFPREIAAEPHGGLCRPGYVPDFVIRISHQLPLRVLKPTQAPASASVLLPPPSTTTQHNTLPSDTTQWPLAPPIISCHLNLPPSYTCRQSMIGLLQLRLAFFIQRVDVCPLHMALQAAALHPAWDVCPLPMALQAASVWLLGGEILIGPSPPLFSLHP